MRNVGGGGAPPFSRGFRTYWATQAISSLGDSCGFIALPLLVLETTDSLAHLGGVTVTGSISAVFASLIAGPIVDRASPRSVILAANAFRAVVNLAIAVCWSTWPTLWLLYVAVGFGAIASAFFQVAHGRITTMLVAKERLTQANGLFLATAAIAFIVGPVLAGGISAAFGPTTAIGANSVSFSIATAGILFVRVRSRLPRDSKWTDYHPINDLFAGLSLTWRQPVLRWLLTLTAATSGLTFGLIDLFIYHLRHDLGQSDARIGVMVGVAAVGAVTGAVVASPLRRRFGFAACWIGATSVAGLAIMTLGLVTQINSLPFVGAGFAFATMLAVVCSTTLWQELAPPDAIGRVTSTFATVQLMALGAGVTVVTTATSGFGARAVFIGAGLAVVGVGAAAVLTPVAARR